MDHRKAREEEAVDVESFPPYANWTSAERALTAAFADTLVILDCCCAGNAMKSSGFPEASRAYELMVATGSDLPTIGPGPRSYTHALLAALGALLEEHESFTTADLNQRISKLRNFDTRSQLYNRLPSRTRHICIAPPARAKPTINSQAMTSSGSLTVRIDLGGQTRLGDEEVVKLARQLSKLPISTGLSISKISLTGYSPYRVGSLLRHLDVVSAAMARYRRRRRSASRRTRAILMAPSYRVSRRRTAACIMAGTVDRPTRSLSCPSAWTQSTWDLDVSARTVKETSGRRVLIVQYQQL